MNLNLFILSITIYVIGLIIGTIMIGIFVPREGFIKNVDRHLATLIVIIWPFFPIIYLWSYVVSLVVTYFPKKLIEFGEYLRERFYK